MQTILVFFIVFSACAYLGYSAFNRKRNHSKKPSTGCKDCPAFKSRSSF